MAKSNGYTRRCYSNQTTFVFHDRPFSATTCPRLDFLGDLLRVPRDLSVGWTRERSAASLTFGSVFLIPCPYRRNTQSRPPFLFLPLAGDERRPIRNMRIARRISPPESLCSPESSRAESAAFSFIRVFIHLCRCRRAACVVVVPLTSSCDCLIGKFNTLKNTRLALWGCRCCCSSASQSPLSISPERPHESVFSHGSSVWSSCRMSRRSSSGLAPSE